MLDSVRLEILLNLTQDSARFAPNVPQPQKSFWTHLMVLLGDAAQVEARFSPFEYSANVDLR
jgi:hypothetical protein